ncbi:MAG TPA: hypothetical protein VLT45_09860 [Kofleriaceae bacterium]|nr:hypothetical protein [Kofleriaceae bacterium]
MARASSNNQAAAVGNDQPPTGSYMVTFTSVANPITTSQGEGWIVLDPRAAACVERGMSYRDDLDALRARHASLDAEVAETAKERDRAAGLLEDAKARAKLPVLPNLRVATPCRADWNEMVGDERVRHCTHCDKDVFNLSAMTREQAEALVIERAGDLCARYYQRHDGTILLKDCSVGIAQKKKRRMIAAGAAGLLALGGGMTWLALSQRVEQVRMGTVAFEPTENVQMTVHAEALDDVPPPPPPAPVPSQGIEGEIHATMGAVAIVHDIEPEPVPPPTIVEDK